MNSRAIIIAEIATLLAVGVTVGVFIFHSSKAPSAPVSGSTPTIGGGGNASRPPTRLGGILPAATSQPEIVPEIAQKPQTVEFFGTTISIPSPFIGILKPLVPFASGLQNEPSPAGSFSSQEALPQSGYAPATSALTHAQVFDVLYPPFFISGLRDVQNQLVAEGFVSPIQTAKFDSEKDIEGFLLTVGEYLASRGLINENERVSYQESVKGFFDRPYEAKLDEATGLLTRQTGGSFEGFRFSTRQEALDEFYRTSGIKEGLPPDALKLLPLKTPENRVGAKESDNKTGRVLAAALLRSVMFLERFFSLPSVQAFCGPTYCTRPAICFLEGQEPQEGGSDFVTPCCSGRICGVPIGCLELCGNGTKPFIWDPVTNICGCGEGAVAGVGP